MSIMPTEAYHDPLGSTFLMVSAARNAVLDDLQATRQSVALNGLYRLLMRYRSGRMVHPVIVGQTRDAGFNIRPVHAGEGFLASIRGAFDAAFAQSYAGSPIEEAIDRITTVLKARFKNDRTVELCEDERQRVAAFLNSFIKNLHQSSH